MSPKRMVVGSLQLALWTALAVLTTFGQNTFPSTGNVGVGTQSPISPLTITSADGADIGLRISDAAVPSGYTQMAISGTGQTFQVGVGNANETSRSVANKFYVYNTNAGLMSFVVDSSSHMGIGTTMPSGLLHVYGSNQNGTAIPLFKLTDTNTNQLLAIDNGALANDFRIVTWGGTTSNLELQAGINSNQLFLHTSGNVGIGTASPGATLEVNGTAKVDNGLYFAGASAPQTTPWTGVLCGGDYAEAVTPSQSKQFYVPGDVLVLAVDRTGSVERSTQAYSTMVAGIYATKPGVIGRRESLPQGGPELPMAMVGIVPTKVSAENGPIRQGDLLVSSSTPGYAMKGTDRSRMLGAVIGKAMGSLDSGKGVIEVLVTLQ